MQTLTAGDLRNKVGFYRRVVTSDGFGNSEGGFLADANFVTAANIAPRLGGETVLAGRLTGTNLVNITVRQSTATRTIDPAWRAKDENSGAIYNIRSVIDPDEGTSDHGRWFEMLCEKGVAT